MPTGPAKLIFAVNEFPSFGKMVLLGLQQVCVISIYLVIIVIVARSAGAPPLVVQSTVSLGMIALAVGAIFQALWRGPIGSGYLAPPVISAIYLSPSLLAVSRGGLPLVFGMTMFAGLFEVTLARLLHRFRAVFPPLVCGFIVLAVGIELGLVGTKQLIDVEGRVGTADFDLHVVVSTFTLALMVGLSIWARGMVRLFSALLGILLGWMAALAGGLVERAALQSIVNSPMFGFPGVQHLSYSFDAGLIVPFLIAGLAAALRTIGVVTTCQRINDADWKRPSMPSIEGGVLADGLSCVLGGSLGVVGMSSSPTAVGVSQATGATSRYIAFAIAGWFFLLACLPKLSAVFMALPQAVLGAALVFGGSMMLVSGIQILTSRPLDVRKTFIVGISLLLGLSREAFPAYYAALPRWMGFVTGTLLSIATISVVLLNVLLRFGIRRTEATTISIGESGHGGFDKMVSQEAKDWGAAADVVDKATKVADTLFEYIQDGHLADGPITARISFDEVKFDVDIKYKGELLRLPARRVQSEEEMLEEMPMAHGLSGFLVGIYPDLVRCSANDNDCHIQLSFYV